MKFVFAKSEVAHALSMTPAEFDENRTNLEANDFPKPIHGLHERWSIIDVINWVNRCATSPSKFSGLCKSEISIWLN